MPDVAPTCLALLFWLQLPPPLWPPPQCARGGVPARKPPLAPPHAPPTWHACAGLVPRLGTQRPCHPLPRARPTCDVDDQGSAVCRPGVAAVADPANIKLAAAATRLSASVGGECLVLRVLVLARAARRPMVDRAAVDRGDTRLPHEPWIDRLSHATDRAQATHGSGAEARLWGRAPPCCTWKLYTGHAQPSTVHL